MRTDSDRMRPMHSHYETFDAFYVDYLKDFLRAKLLTKLLISDRTVTELAEILASDAPYVSLNVRELEKRELVIRTEDPDDRRRHIIGLTDAGRRLAETARSIADAPPPEFTTTSAEDLAHLRRILRLP